MFCLFGFSLMISDLGISLALSVWLVTSLTGVHEWLNCFFRSSRCESRFSEFELRSEILRAWLYTILFLECNGWHESNHKYKCLSVGLVNSSEIIQPSTILKHVSKNGSPFSPNSPVNLKTSGYKELRNSKNYQKLLCRRHQIPKTSSINRSHSLGFCGDSCHTLLSTSPIAKQA